MKLRDTSKIRITSGAYRSREILVPNIAHAMGSRERLALFNSISSHLSDATVLDCFAGSGSLGIEALSRGAKSATFVDNSPKATAIISQNLANLGIKNATVVKANVKSFNPSQTFKIIFADPPYDNFRPADLENIANFLSGDGIFVLSHPADFIPEINGLRLKSTKKYAACHISLFTK